MGERGRERDLLGCACACACALPLPQHTHTHPQAPIPTHTHTHAHISPLLPSLSLSLGWPCLLPPSPPLFLFLSSPLSHNNNTSTHTNAWPWLHAASPSTPHSPTRKKRRKGVRILNTNKQPCNTSTSHTTACNKQ